MPIYIAAKTLAAIDAAIERDGGAAFRVMEGRVLPHIEDAYRGEDTGYRSHLGASLIGRPCGRDLWYGFRWAKKAKFSARMLRLFNRGHLEEGRFIALLLIAGMRVVQQDENGHQFKISRLGGHLGGSGDGIILGCPDIPEGQKALSEFKTHGSKSFAKLVKDGVQKAKPEHYVQMQSYMFEMAIMYALYMAVNKDTDELYAEILIRDDSVAHQYFDRAERIIMMTSPPARLHESAAMFDCKFCDRKSICHYGEPMDKNCRTCVFSQPVPDGTWRCNKYNATIPKEAQLVGCGEYQQIV